jgi:hypothetical protein
MVQILHGHVSEALMQVRQFNWLIHDFLYLRAEAEPGSDADAQTVQVLSRIETELGRWDLTLADTVRTRLWARDRASRAAGGQARVRALAGEARSASSSFIAPGALDSDAEIAIELWATRPLMRGERKTLVEYDPPVVPLRYLVLDGIVVLSGMTSVLPTLDEQIVEICTSIQSALLDARTDWEYVAQLSCLLQRGESIEQTTKLIRRRTGLPLDRLDFTFVDGFSTEGKLIELETTAAQPA